VERALTLVANGVITVAIHKAAKLENKLVTIPRSKNESSGKESLYKAEFSDACWGNATNIYAGYASKMSASKVNAILNQAKEFVKPISYRKATQASDPMKVDEDEDRTMVDNTDTESD
jgi:hypothetical protein